MRSCLTAIVLLPIFGEIIPEGRSTRALQCLDEDTSDMNASIIGSAWVGKGLADLDPSCYWKSESHCLLHAHFIVDNSIGLSQVPFVLLQTSTYGTRDSQHSVCISYQIVDIVFEYNPLYLAMATRFGPRATINIYNKRKRYMNETTSASSYNTVILEVRHSWIALESSLVTARYSELAGKDKH